MYNILFILLQQSGAPAGGSGGNIMSIVLMVGVMVVFYLFFILPQIRRQKKEKAFRENLKSGDKIITIGGEHGKIVNLDDHSVLVEVSEGVKIRYERAAIRQIAGEPIETKK